MFGSINIRIATDSKSQTIVHYLKGHISVELVLVLVTGRPSENDLAKTGNVVGIGIYGFRYRAGTKLHFFDAVAIRGR